MRSEPRSNHGPRTKDHRLRIASRYKDFNFRVGLKRPTRKFRDAASMIFDGCPDGSSRCSSPDRFGHPLRLVSKPVLEIGANRDVNRFRQAADVLEFLVERDHPVLAAERLRKSRARRCQRFETKLGQQARRTCVPRIWNDECARALMERFEAMGPVGLGGLYQWKMADGKLENGRFTPPVRRST